tara:strand:+ start:1487 stop:2485 length:999 start_codon:yes stop_codon:yes gene_type:complete
MLYKSYQIESDVSTLQNYQISLFYGENEGLKNDIKNQIKIKNKHINSLNFFQDEIINKPSLVIDEISNSSLFEDKKIIFINNISDKMTSHIQEFLDIIKNDQIYCFADTLTRKSKLRSLFEKDQKLAIVPCYVDNEITLKNLILKKLYGYRPLSAEIINNIYNTCSLDRMKINNEIEKIKMYFQDKKLDNEVISILLNNKIIDEFSLIKDEALKGNKIKTNKLLSETDILEDNNHFYLSQINIRLAKLLEIQKLKLDGYSIDSIINNFKPPIFWKDKSTILEQSKKWRTDNIKKALRITYELEMSIKKNSQVSNSVLIKNLLINLCCEASTA